MKCVFASELAAVTGNNRYQEQDEAIQKMVDRNNGKTEETPVEQLELEKAFLKDFPDFDEREKDYITDKFGSIDNVKIEDSSDEKWENVAIIKALKIQKIPSEMVEKLNEMKGNEHATKAYGNVVEKAEVMSRGIDLDEVSQIKLKRKLNDEWLLYGKADYCENGVITEIKSRTHRIFTYIPNREKIQLLSYMWMSQETDHPCKKGILKQIHGDEEMMSYYDWEEEKEWFQEVIEEFLRVAETIN